MLRKRERAEVRVRPDGAALWTTECDSHCGGPRLDHGRIQQIRAQYLPKHVPAANRVIWTLHQHSLVKLA